MSRDGDANTALNNLIKTLVLSSATSGTLTKASPHALNFTGSVFAERFLPVVSTLALGHEFLFINTGSALLNVSSSGTDPVVTIGPLGAAFVKSVLTTGTSAASWAALNIPFLDNDATLVANSPFRAVTQAAIIAYIDVQLTALGFIYPTSLFDHFDDSATTSTNGTEDELRSDNIGNGLVYVDALYTGFKVIQEETLVVVGSATASRRIKKYIKDTSGDNLIWDSGSLTLSLGATFHIRTTIIIIDANNARVEVAVATTSASTVPYVVYNELTNLRGLDGNDEFLTTAAIASGVGAAAGDIVSVMSHTEKVPAAPP